MSERYELASQRLFEIPEETGVPEPFRDFFKASADFLIRCLKKENGKGNENLYRDILPENYAVSYGNPDYASAKLGKEYGPVLSAVYAELYGIIPCIFEGDEEGTTVLLELFLECYTAFGEEEIPSAEETKGIFISYIRDYLDTFVQQRIEEGVNPSGNFAADIIEHADFQDLSYLDRFGEYVSDETRKTAKFMNTLPQELVDRMAATAAEGYLRGFKDRKYIEKKKIYSIRFELGFERFVRALILYMRKKDFEPTVSRAAYRLTDRRGALRIGYYGAVPNRQFDYDHRQDPALVLTEDFVAKKLRAARNAYEKNKDLAFLTSGPVCFETFGEKPFVPEKHACELSLSKEQEKLYVNLQNEMGQIVNRYIIGEERTFTIIAFPVPAIGKDFEAVFSDTVKINLLDSGNMRGFSRRSSMLWTSANACTSSAGGRTIRI